MVENVSNADRPTVSVLIPVYNAKNHLKNCLKSVLVQSFDDFEVILCNDGSTDGSAELCDEFAAKDKRIRVIHQDNAGILNARCSLMAQARGEFIQFVDADDTISHDMLDKTVSFARAADADLVCFGYSVTEDDGKAYKKVTELFPDGAVFTEDDRKFIYRAFVSDWTLNSIWSKLFKKELFDLVTDRPEVNKNLSGEDRLLVAGMLAKAKRIGYLSGPLYNYRLSNEGMSRNVKLDFLLDAQFVNEYVCSVMDEMGLSDDADARLGFLRYNARDIVNYIYDTASDDKYTNEELLEGYKDILDSELSCRVRASVKDYEGSKLQKLIYKGFLNQDYAASIKAVRNAFKTKRLIRRILYLH